jgi:hypothetical protein
VLGFRPFLKKVAFGAFKQKGREQASGEKTSRLIYGEK